MRTGQVWWCGNCGYETESRGRCPGCSERLLPSPLPELEAGSPDEEVGYGLAEWGSRARARLIEALIDDNIPHRFEDEELVVRAADERAVDDLTAAIMARKVWWCRNCGYEVSQGGRCEDCGEDLGESPIPQLDLQDHEDEISYSLSGWDAPMRVRLIEELISAGIAHRLEQGEVEELVVRGYDEPAAASITKGILATANPQAVRRHKDLPSGSTAHKKTVGSSAPGSASPFQGPREPDGERGTWRDIPPEWPAAPLAPDQHLGAPLRSVGAYTALGEEEPVKLSFRRVHPFLFVFGILLAALVVIAAMGLLGSL